MTLERCYGVRPFPFPSLRFFVILRSKAETPGQIIRQLRKLHMYDQNFPVTALEKMNDFLDDPDILAHPERHAELIHEIKVEAILSTENSPYAEVRANVDPIDDPSMPSFTIRTWIIGIIFSGLGAFVNQLFNPRQPSVYIPANVAQLLACESASSARITGSERDRG